jgi:Na+/melibiose symporter-like transporter
MTFSVYGSSLGSLAATSAAPLLLSFIGSDRAGHGVVAWILAVLIAIGGIVTFVLIDTEGPSGRPAPTHADHLSIKETIAALRENQPFQCLIAFKIVMFAGLAMHMSAIPYFTRHVLGASDLSLSSLFLTQTVMMMASQTLWVKLAGRIGRRNGLLTAALLEAIAMAAWWFIPASQPTPWLQICGGMNGLASGGIFFGLYTVLTDTMDLTRRRKGDTGREGILAGVFVMVEKATTALGTFIFSALMGWFGYISARDAGSASQPAGVATGIMLAVSVIPTAAALIACIFLRWMRLDDATSSGSDRSSGAAYNVKDNVATASSLTPSPA